MKLRTCYLKLRLVISNRLLILCSKSPLVKERTQASKNQFNSLPPHLQNSCEIADLSFSSLIHSFSVKSGLGAKANLRALVCCSQHNREVPLKEMTTEQDHPGSAGAVSRSEPLQLVHLPVTCSVLDRGSWQHGLRLSK